VRAQIGGRWQYTSGKATCISSISRAPACWPVATTTRPRSLRNRPRPDLHTPQAKLEGKSVGLNRGETGAVEIASFPIIQPGLDAQPTDGQPGNAVVWIGNSAAAPTGYTCGMVLARNQGVAIST
jgi:hypothetical protein